MKEGGEPIDEADWLPAAEALRRVSQVMPEFQARHAIADRAHDGLVRARAVRFVKHRETFDDVEVPKEFWWAGAHEALEQNWAVGDFSTWINRTYEWKAYGVRFSRNDIEAMLPQRERLAFARMEAGNYAPAAMCLRELQTTLGCDEATAEQLILKSCRAGLIPSRCARIQCRVRDRYGENEEEDTNVAVPQWFWDECLGGEATVLNWRTGRFAGSGIVDGDEHKAIISGVQFQVGAIVELEGMEVRRTHTGDEDESADSSGRFPGGITWIDREYDERLPSEAEDEVTSAVTRTRGGRPPAEWWDDLWVEMCRQLYTGDLQPKKQSHIENAMHEWLGRRGESAATSTVRARARKLWMAIDVEDEN